MPKVSLYGSDARAMRGTNFSIINRIDISGKLRYYIPRDFALQGISVSLKELNQR